MSLNLRRRSLFKTRRRDITNRGIIDNDPGIGCSTEELNDLLTYILEIYPGRDANVCRQALLAASAECKLEEAAAHLADTAVPDEAGAEQGAAGDGLLELWQRFRTESYKSAVAKALRLEFNTLKGSSIRAVLAENNHDYARSRQCLSQITSRSWRRSFLSILRRRRSKADVLRCTGSSELDKEIDLMHNDKKRKSQLESDVRLARQLNEAQHRAADALFECECCFGDITWEDLCFCSDFHYFCRRCLRRSVEEGLYGQGSCFDHRRASVRCISSVADPACTSSVSPALLPRFLPSEVISTIDDHFAKSAIDRSDKSTLICPFCPYAVEIIVNAPLRRHGRAASLLPPPHYTDSPPYTDSPIRSALLDFWRWLSILPFAAQQDPAQPLAEPDQRQPMHADASASPAQRHDLRDWETIFHCRNPRCLRESCLKCGREWMGIHDCSKDADNRRTFVERRLDETVKRTCPRCNTSFIKDGGCNKMTCSVCGYKMCYLCRADVRDKLYKHFCTHFRAVPGTACKSCSLCSLFQDEVEDEIIMVATAAAEEEWDRKQREKYSRDRRCVGPAL